MVDFTRFMGRGALEPRIAPICPVGRVKPRSLKIKSCSYLSEALLTSIILKTTPYPTLFAISMRILVRQLAQLLSRQVSQQVKLFAPLYPRV